ncbi:hypothetical protein H9L39_09700 [Fusarium oxysporum f. sp. albedinis]|nr:hypothetical protein H9L39_09700 [Fusarium oxysporum f. sp. albedinis]
MAVYVWAGADSCLAYYWIHLLSSYPGFPPTDLSIPPPLYVSPGDLTLFLSDGSFTCWRKGGLEYELSVGIGIEILETVLRCGKNYGDLHESEEGASTTIATHKEAGYDLG